MSDIAGDTTFNITDTKLYVTLVTLSTEENVKLKKQLNEGFKRPVYWNKYKMHIWSDHRNPKRITLNSSFQWVKRLFVLAFDNTDKDWKNQR